MVESYNDENENKSSDNSDWDEDDIIGLDGRESRAHGQSNGEVGLREDAGAEAGTQNGHDTDQYARITPSTDAVTSGPLPSRGNRTLYVNVDSPRAESRYKGTEREPLLSGNSEESPLTSRGASPDLSDAASPVGLGYPGLPAHAYSEAGHIYHSYLLKRTLSVPHNLAQYRDREGVHVTGFGGKHIRGIGSFVLNLNNIMGPALVLLPLLNQEAGWVSPQVLGTLFCILSAVVSSMLVEAMQRIPGNRGFNERYEFVTLMRHYFGKRGFYVGQVAYNLTNMATNMAQMTITCQVLDKLIRRLLGTSVAINYSTFPPSLAWHPMHQPWSDQAIGEENHVSLGFVAALATCLPLGVLNLDGNMWFQYISAVGFFVFVGGFLLDFRRLMFTDPSVMDAWPSPLTPPITDLFDQASVLGVTLFFHAYVVTIPSWVNEKARGISVSKAIWWPTVVTAVFKVVFGLAGAWAFKLLTFPNGVDGTPRGEPLPSASNILNFMLERTQVAAVRYAVYAFTVLTLMPGIPVICIMTRYNLLSGDLCSPRMASLLAVGVPWAITAFTYNRGLLLTACNWVALLVQGYTNFVLPAALYLEALRRHKYPEEMEEEGLERLPSTRSMRRRRNPVVATIPEDEEYLGDLEERLLSEEDLIEVDNADFSDEPIFKAFPEFVTARVKAHTLASWIMWSMLALSTFAVGFNTVCSFLGISTDAD